MKTKLRLLYTDEVTKEKIGTRKPENYPYDDKYIKLALKEPTYERIAVCFKSDVDALVEEQKEEYDKLLSDIKHCITLIYKKLFDERVKFSKKVLFGLTKNGIKKRMTNRKSVE